MPGHRPVYLADSLSLPQEHQADFFLEPDGSHPLLEVANELSRLFEQNQSRVGHYLKLLSQDQEAVRLAVIDAWMRSAWPDPDRQQKKSVELGGGWVTRRYQTYLAGERPPDEFQAWANTTYSYTLIKRMFEAIASYQWSSGGPLQRPLPAQSGEATPQAQTAGASFQFDASGKLLAAWTQGPDEPAGEERGSGGALDPATTLPLIGKHAEREEPPQGDVLKKVRSGKPLPARLVKDIARLQAALGPAFAVQAMVFSQSRKVVIGLQGATQIWYVSTPGDGEALLSAWAQQEGRAEEVVKGT